MDDSISRQAAYATALAMYVRCDTGNIEDYIDLMCESILALPSAQPEHATCYLDSPCEYQNPDAKLPSVQPERCEDCENFSKTRLLIPQPEIVRCEDCKHSQRWYSDKCICFLWSKTGNSVFDDGYCSYG